MQMESLYLMPHATHTQDSANKHAAHLMKVHRDIITVAQASHIIVLKALQDSFILPSLYLKDWFREVRLIRELAKNPASCSHSEQGRGCAQHRNGAYSKLWNHLQHFLCSR